VEPWEDVIGLDVDESERCRRRQNFSEYAKVRQEKWITQTGVVASWEGDVSRRGWQSAPAPKSHFTANAKTLDRESIVVTLFYFAQDTQQQWNRQKGRGQDGEHG